jgi:hypothetical protein
MPSAPFERAKQDTIKVTKGINAKLPHHMGLVQTYQIERKMPLVHHVVNHQECNYIVENNNNQDGRTQGHLMLKPKC